MMSMGAALALAIATGAEAQSLLDAAKRAEDQRLGQAGQEVQVLKAAVEREDEDHPQLTEDLVHRYARARLALADFRRRDKDVQQRLIAATRESHHYVELADILANEPAVVTLLDSFRLSPRLYVAVDIALRQIQDRRRYPTQLREPTDREKENIAFVTDHQYSIEAVMQQCMTHEQGVKLWFAVTPSVW